MEFSLEKIAERTEEAAKILGTVREGKPEKTEG